MHVLGDDLDRSADKGGEKAGVDVLDDEAVGCIGVKPPTLWKLEGVHDVAVAIDSHEAAAVAESHLDPHRGVIERRDEREAVA
ncbi:MAG: hypothetical protein M3163_06795 [Actinomycetota bacterium]|nr:hypothetical protein [Actinomycetota bacterium]